MSSDPSSSATAIRRFPGTEHHSTRSLIPACVCGWRIFNVVAAHGFMLHECKRCGTAHQRIFTTAESIDDYYDGSYHADPDRHAGQIGYAARYAMDRVAAGKRLKRYRQTIAAAEVRGWYESSLSTKSAVDVGCGNCAFVDELLEAGFGTVAGIDPDPVDTQGRSYVRKGRISSVVGRYDLITYHDVLEHLVDPGLELAMAVTGLARDGLLIVEVPDSFEEAGHKHFKAEHLWHFSAQGLEEIGATFPELARISRYEPIPGKRTIIWQNCAR